MNSDSDMVSDTGKVEKGKIKIEKRVQSYRGRAQTLRKNAAALTHDVLRRRLLTVAEEWERLAAYTERLELNVVS